MNILVWHGYLLSGTGSNVYIQNISREFCRRGHNVYLFCQDAKALDYDFVNVHSFFDKENSKTSAGGERRSPYRGFCRVLQPDIGGLLPVFVYDKYKGFTVKTFLELSDSELSEYVRKNVSAVNTLLDEVKIDIIIADHGVIAPYIMSLSEAGGTIPYIVVLQGSDLEFTIKKSEKYLNKADSGLKEAAAVIAVTDHIYRETKTLFGEVVRKKIIKVLSGVNVSIFSKMKSSTAAGELEMEVEIFLKDQDRGFDDDRERESLSVLPTEHIDRPHLANIHDRYNDRHPDRQAAAKLNGVNGKKLAVFIGKLMTTKGAHIAIASWPLLLKNHAGAVLVVVGFGELREALELLVEALSSGNLEKLLKTANLIDGYLPETPYLRPFYNSLIETEAMGDYLLLSREANKNIIFTGLLYHEQTRYLLPLVKAQLTLSIFPEAFGLVVLEGAACGTVPIVTDHSGLHDVAVILEKASGVSDGYFRVPPEPEKIFYDLAERVSAVMNLTDGDFSDLSERIASAAKEHFSWESVAAELERHMEKIVSNSRSIAG